MDNSSGRGVTPQDYEVYARFMQSQPAPMGGQQQPAQQNSYAKGGIVSKINPLYTYQVGLRSLHQLDTDPQIQGGVLPSLPALGAPLDPVGLSSLVPEQPGQLPVPEKYATGGIVGLSPLQQRMAQAMRYYTGMGYSPAQAAGIVGNLTAESSLNPTAVGDKGTSFGLMQAHNERAQALRNYGGDNWRDFQTQLGFVPHELSTTESTAGRALSKAQNVEQATQAMIGYERPQGWSVDNPTAGHNYSGRLDYARQALALNGQPVSDVAALSTPQAAEGVATALDPSIAANAASEAAQTAAQASETADPFGGLMGLFAMSQMQQAPAPAPAPTVRKPQQIDPDYQTAVTSQTPDAYADYIRRRRMMMGA